MINGKKILAIIPARGGSKGLPGKNIKLLCGKPLLMWPYFAAKNSKYIDEIIISTEDELIAKTAQENGAIIPFLRPQKYALDKSPSSEAIIFTIMEFKNRGLEFGYIVLLEPTSPLTDSSDINSAIEILLSNYDAKSIVGVSKLESAHPDFVMSKENGFLRPFISTSKITRRQDLKELFFFDGSLYISEIDYYLEHKTFYTEHTLGFESVKYKSFEIDDEIDFYIVERLMELKLKNLI